MKVMDKHIDELDKRIVTGLASGLTLKKIARQEYKLKDWGKGADLCLKAVKARYKLLLFNFEYKTESQLVIVLIHEQKLVNYSKDNTPGEPETRQSISK